MSGEAMSLLPAALRIAKRREMEFAAGLDEFGFRACRPDFTSRNGFRWPFPGRWADAGGPYIDHRGECPRSPGDGLCVGLSWRGVASGGIAVHLVLLVGWKSVDVLGRSSEKARVKRVFVVDALTVGGLLADRAEGESADLRGVDLIGVDLYGADLRGADLRGADLRGAYLYGADREYAKSRGAIA